MSNRRSHLYVTGTGLAVLCLAIACAAWCLGYYFGHKQGSARLLAPSATTSEWRLVGPESNLASVTCYGPHCWVNQ